MKFLLITAFLFYSFALSGQCNLNGQLPTSLPESSTCIEEANFIIAVEFAPEIRQLVEHTMPLSDNGKADLIVPLDFNGFENIADNWTQLENTPISQLTPKVYFSVVWTSETWLVSYGLYHARDYSNQFSSEFGNCCTGFNFGLLGSKPGDNHEHDYEGAIIIVDRQSGSNFGKVVGGYSTFHNELLKYDDITTVPTVFCDNQTHAVELNLSSSDDISDWENPCDDGSSIGSPNNQLVYTHSPTNIATIGNLVESQENPNFLAGQGQYELEDIFSVDLNSLGSRRFDESVFTGNIIKTEPSGGCEDFGSPAKAPWGWNQFDYSTQSIQELVCRALFNDGQQNDCNESPSIILHNPYDPCITSSTMLLVENDQTISGESLVFSGITIKDGAQLTIHNSTIDFVCSGFIHVEVGGILIIDNSLIGSSDYWQGIKLETKANSTESGSIEIKNNSVIWGAEVGLTVGTLGHWNYSRNVTVEDSKFLRNGIGIKFNSGYGKTEIKSTHFANENIDISMVGANGISTHQCPFYNENTNPAYIQIDGLSSNFEVDNCGFYHGLTGLLALEHE